MATVLPSRPLVIIENHSSLYCFTKLYIGLSAGYLSANLLLEDIYFIYKLTLLSIPCELLSLTLLVLLSGSPPLLAPCPFASSSRLLVALFSFAESVTLGGSFSSLTMFTVSNLLGLSSTLLVGSTIRKGICFLI